MSRRRYTFEHIRTDLLERSDSDLLRLMGWQNHALPLRAGQRNWLAGHLAVQLERNAKINPDPKQATK